MIVAELLNEMYLVTKHICSNTFQSVSYTVWKLWYKTTFHGL